LSFRRISRSWERSERSGRDDGVRLLCAAESFLRDGRDVRALGRDVRELFEATAINSRQ
jgi:hypothetical protein